MSLTLDGTGSISGLTATGISAVQTIPASSITQAMLTTAASSIGVGQTWQDVTGSRALSTTYTNSTGKPIQVNAWMAVSGSPAGNVDAGLTVGGVVVMFASNYFNAAAGNRFANVTGIVPNGTTYSVTAPTGAGTLNWVELR
jgi:hypothetical protein